MSKEAMKLALEALEWCHGGEPCGTAEAITALREALAEQPAQQEEPEHIVHSNGRYSPLLTHMMNKRVKSNLKQVIELYDSPDQPAPPPECKTEAEKIAYAFGWFKALESVREKPAQRTWVGLTLEDMETTHWSPDFRAGAKWAAAKLKEKNTP